MLHGIACLVTAVSLIAGSPSLPSAPAAEFVAAPSRIVGRVIDGKSRAGIGAVRVRLDDGRAETTTAPDGGFEFADVLAGRHSVVAILEGFAPSAPMQVVVETDADARVEIEYSLGRDDRSARHGAGASGGSATGLARPGGVVRAADCVGRGRPRRPPARDATAPRRGGVPGQPQRPHGAGRRCDGDGGPAGRVRAADGQPLRVARRRRGRAQSDPVRGGRPGGCRDQRILGRVRRTGVGPARHRHEKGRHVARPRPRRGWRGRRARPRRGPAARAKRASRFVARVGAPEHPRTRLLGWRFARDAQLHRTDRQCRRSAVGAAPPPRAGAPIVGRSRRELVLVRGEGPGWRSGRGPRRRQPHECVDAKDGDRGVGLVVVGGTDAQRGRAVDQQLHGPFARALPAGASRGSADRDARREAARRRGREAL